MKINHYNSYHSGTSILLAILISAFESINSCTVSLHPSMHANINGLNFPSGSVDFQTTKSICTEKLLPLSILYIKTSVTPWKIDIKPENGGGWFRWCSFSIGWLSGSMFKKIPGCKQAEKIDLHNEHLVDMTSITQLISLISKEHDRISRRSCFDQAT